jgi:hypothetical protein
MTRRNGGVEEPCQQMEFVRMTVKRMAIEGEWFTIQFFKEGDGSIRVEVEKEITGKRYKMYPDNKINLDTEETIE